MCVCVCVCVRERERENLTCVPEQREEVYECVCVCVWERERERVRISRVCQSSVMYIRVCSVRRCMCVFMRVCVRE